MARAVLAFVLLAAVGLAVAVPRPVPDRPPASAAPTGARAELPTVAEVLRANPSIRLPPAPLHVPRGSRRGAPCSRDSNGPCIRVCTYLARTAQPLTPGCPAVAPAGCAYLVSARTDCRGAQGSTPLPAPQRPLPPPFPRRRVIP